MTQWEGVEFAIAGKIKKMSESGWGDKDPAGCAPSSRAKSLFRFADCAHGFEVSTSFSVHIFMIDKKCIFEARDAAA